MRLAVKRGKYYKLVNNTRTEIKKEEYEKLQAALADTDSHGRKETKVLYETKEVLQNSEEGSEDIEAGSEGVQQAEENSWSPKKITRGFGEGWQ